MEEKEIIVKDFDLFWKSEKTTFNKFMDIFYSFMSKHENEIWDEAEDDDYTGLEFYLNKGFCEKELDNLFQELYKEVVGLLGEPTEKQNLSYEGIYFLCLEWNYPTHSYCMRFEYVYDGYEEMHYDIDFEDCDDEDDYKEIELLNHRVCCGLRINGAF